MLLWIIGSIALVLLAALVIGYLTFRDEKAALRDEKAALKERLQDRDNKLAKLTKENQQLHDALVLARREASAPQSILKRDSLTDARLATEESSSQFCQQGGRGLHPMQRSRRSFWRIWSLHYSFYPVVPAHPGPELVVYRPKGESAPLREACPTASAGRVGQFNRWFENAVAPWRG
ncbi:MAG: hypothetical protein IPI44_24765 [Sulfuritalea sp.]|nr:hypothetical protein [Sulfuritalea sp.]